jgi:type IV secretion system T-DNA border endonuclease VirD2
MTLNPSMTPPVPPTPVLTEPKRRQAFVRIVPRGGAKSAIQIFNQLTYLSRNGDLPLQRSERHLSVPLSAAGLKTTAESWVREAGFCQSRRDAANAVQALTTHLIVSFPYGTDVRTAFIAGRSWAQEMFGSGRHGGTFDYLTACHDDRPHPHVHLIVNRRALEGHWLKISRRHPELSYDQLRTSLVAVARRYGISLEASSRAARGLKKPAITYAEYRRSARRLAAFTEPPPATEPADQQGNGS